MDFTSRTNRRGAAIAGLAMISTTGARAEALGSVGVEAGVVQRRVSMIWPDSLRTGFGFGAHAELDLHPLVKLGPYYLYSRVGADPATRLRTDDGEGWFDGGAFHGVGVRARFCLPIPGRFKPYAQIGLGHTWFTYQRGPLPDQSRAFFEAPLGIGIAYELSDFVSLSFDASYRHGFWHYGRGIGDGDHGSTGTSFLLGAMFGI
jgi:opacity protein-like surface antigen